jgi:hypothetical protein
MVKLSKSVLARRTVTEKLGSLDVSYDSYTITQLVELYGSDAKLNFDYEYDYYGSCCGERRATCEVTRDRLETDEEYNARIESAKSKQRKAAATRAETAAAKARAEAEAAAAQEAEERRLYEELRKKFGD